MGDSGTSLVPVQNRRDAQYHDKECFVGIGNNEESKEENLEQRSITATANLKELKHFLTQGPEYKYINRVSIRIEDLLEEANNGEIPTDLYTQENLALMTDVFHTSCREKQGLIRDNMEKLSAHWYNMVKRKGKRQNGAAAAVAIENFEDDRVGHEQNLIKRKKVEKEGPKSQKRRTQEELKQDEHWECPACKRAFCRNAFCIKHITKLHAGKAEPVKKQGQNPVSTIGFPQTQVLSSRQLSLSSALGSTAVDGNGHGNDSTADTKGFSTNQVVFLQPVGPTNALGAAVPDGNVIIQYLDLDPEQYGDKSFNFDLGEEGSTGMAVWSEIERFNEANMASLSVPPS